MNTEKQLKKVSKPNVILEPGKENEGFSPDIVYKIELGKILPSPFEPQARRRKRFKTADIESLGASFLKQGQIQPILVRPIFSSKFQIVFGERRFLAAGIGGFQKIKTFVRELSDLEVLELQYQENHQRAENHPLDDAFTFKYLQENENLSVSQLADKFGTSEQNVTEKLKLNDLIPEAVADLEDGVLPLRHAYYLAKFPARSQKEILDDGLPYQYGDKADGACSYIEFKETVDEDILRRLDSAPFDTSDERLHLKGLICPECPERTGFSPMLFPDFKKGDSCLNKSCFEAKTNVHFRLKHSEIAEEIAAAEKIPIGQALEKVPLVTEHSWAHKSDTPMERKILTDQVCLERAECDFAQKALIAKGERKGQFTFVCTEKSCKIHNAPKSAATADETSGETPVWKLRSQEEDFNRRVSAGLRQKVFAESLKFFTDTNVFWQFADLTAKLIYEFFYTGGSMTRDEIFELVRDWKNAPKDFQDKEKTFEFLMSLDKQKSSQILFLLAHKEELYAGYNDIAIKSESLRDVCKGYTKLDLKLLDAEIRLELAPEEFKQIADEYYHRVFTNKDTTGADPPHFWYKEPEE